MRAPCFVNCGKPICQKVGCVKAADDEGMWLLDPAEEVEEPVLCLICDRRLLPTYVNGNAHWGCPVHGTRGVAA